MGAVLRRWTALLIAICMMTACVEYVPVPASSKYDQAWNAALGAVQDSGVAITQAEPSSGLIRGVKNGIDVTATVSRQYDGSVQVRFDTKGGGGEGPQLANRLSQAYERRMGR